MRIQHSVFSIQNSLSYIVQHVADPVLSNSHRAALDSDIQEESVADMDIE
jgi:hypothetical protein